MRFGTRLFAALVLAAALADAARAQVSGPSSASGPGLSRKDSSYTGPYSVYGPGLTYRPLDYTGPYSGRLPSASGLARTRTDFDSSRTAGRPDAGRAAATGGEPGVRRTRYVRLSVAGTTVQAVVIP